MEIKGMWMLIYQNARPYSTGRGLESPQVIIEALTKHARRVTDKMIIIDPSLLITRMKAKLPWLIDVQGTGPQATGYAYVGVSGDYHFGFNATGGHEVLFESPKALVGDARDRVLGQFSNLTPLQAYNCRAIGVIMSPFGFLPAAEGLMACICNEMGLLHEFHGLHCKVELVFNDVQCRTEARPRGEKRHIELRESQFVVLVVPTTNPMHDHVFSHAQQIFLRGKQFILQGLAPMPIFPHRTKRTHGNPLPASFYNDYCVLSVQANVDDIFGEDGLALELIRSLTRRQIKQFAFPYLTRTLSEEDVDWTLKLVFDTLIDVTLLCDVVLESLPGIDVDRSTAGIVHILSGLCHNLTLLLTSL
jgi:hypothetical protein